METILCECGSEQTEPMQANHDDYIAYRCHSCGDMFQLVPDVHQYITAPVEPDKILFDEEMRHDTGGIPPEEYFLLDLEPLSDGDVESMALRWLEASESVSEELAQQFDVEREL